MSKNGIGHVYERAGAHYLAVRIQGRRYKKRAGATAEEAEGKSAQLGALLDTGMGAEEALGRVFPKKEAVRGSDTFKRLSPNYLKHAARELRETTLEKLKSRMRRLESAPWALKPLRSVTPADINRWTDARARTGRGVRGGPISACGVNRDLACVGAFFKWAIAHGFAETNPARGPQVNRRDERASRKETWYDAAEQDYLHLVCGDVAPDFGPFLRLAFLTGARRRELRLAVVADLDVKARTLTIRAANAKNGKALVTAD